MKEGAETDVCNVNRDPLQTGGKQRVAGVMVLVVVVGRLFKCHWE